jgi:hypothetical protein
VKRDICIAQTRRDNGGLDEEVCSFLLQDAIANLIFSIYFINGVTDALKEGGAIIYRYTNFPTFALLAGLDKLFMDSPRSVHSTLSSYGNLLHKTI